MSTDDTLQLARVPSGIEGLDAILQGGFLQGGVYIVQGVPGAGKTIFANEICFKHVAKGNKAVYVTLLAESHTRMLQHLRPMSFFDEAVIPADLYYVSAFRTLEEEGLKGLVSLLRREIKSQQASLLVLDGLVAAEETAGSDREFKKFIHELQAHAAAHDCTILLLTSGPTRVMNAEHTMVDGLIELDDQLFEVRTQRSLQVRKFRGSGFLRGRHAFRITADGIMLFPRIEAAFAGIVRPNHARRSKMSTGVAGFDVMLSGGIPALSTTAIVGATGTGKTTLGLHFLSQCSKNEPGLLFGFFEPPERLIEKAAAIGIDLAGLVKRGDVEVMWQVQGENILDELAHRLLDAVKRRGVRRLVIDGMGGFLEAAVNRERISRYFACLTNELRSLGVTVVINVEARDFMGASLTLPVSGFSALIENVVFLRFVERESCLRRMISVLKVRDSDYDIRLREFQITNHGVDIGEPFHGAEGISRGIAHEIAPNK